MVIVFDLDDTLYEELSFVKSGLKCVADYLSPLLKMDSSQIWQELIEELTIQRDKVFDRFLSKKKMNKSLLIRQCLSVYRSHDPLLELFPEAKSCLLRLKNYPLYIVTDGNHLVQRKKVMSLGLHQLVKQSLFTYAHGKERGKPSPYCFAKICQREGVKPHDVVYIGDNPNKDFIGIKPLGFQTIRVLTGPYRNLVVDEAHEAALKIKDLSELDEELIKKLTA